MSSTATPQRPRKGPWADIVLLVWLVAVWGALWADWRPGNLLLGLVLAVLVTRALRLPPITLHGRFNVLHFVVFLGTFVWQVAKGSFDVLRLALVQGPAVRNAVVGVRLRYNDDLRMTAVGHTMALIPGSLVVEVDRSTGTLYFHVLDVANAQQSQEFRESVLRAEASWICIMGSQDEVDALKRELRSGITASTAVISSPTTHADRAAGAGRPEGE